VLSSRCKSGPSFIHDAWSHDVMLALSSAAELQMFCVMVNCSSTASSCIGRSSTVVRSDPIGLRAGAYMSISAPRIRATAPRLPVEVTSSGEL
jgi:hypothetical protein